MRRPAIPITPEIPDSRALRQTFEDIRRRLGVRRVGLVFRSYALYPTFLLALWEQLRPNFGIRLNEDYAARVRLLTVAQAVKLRDAIAELGPPAEPGLVPVSGEAEYVRETMARHRRQLPTYVLTLSAMHQLLYGAVLAGAPASASQRMEAIPVVEGPPPLAPPEPRGALVRPLLSDLGRRTGIAEPPELYQDLSQAPEFFAHFSPLLAATIYNEAMDAACDEIAGEVDILARMLPHPLRLDDDVFFSSGLRRQQATRLAEVFRRLYPRLLLQLELMAATARG
ncbi:MAG: hypothetical protein HYV63_04565 [Candidatus Schekmanbacteria bacterium]|nr:hypothetical protein [Candidatus Schekmanbacteria bacterium]